MRNQRVIVLLTSLATFGVAIADPAPAPDVSSSDSMHVAVTVGKGRLGVSVLQISPELRRHFGAPSDRGVMIDAITPESPAARAGLQVGDVIVEVDGDSAVSATDVIEAMRDRKKGEPVAVAIVRAGQRSELRATLTEDPRPAWRPDPQIRRWLDERSSGHSPFGRPESDRELDDARKRIEALEKRLQRLEQE